MNIKQKLLKLSYPLTMRISKSGDKGRIIRNKQQTPPLHSFYALRTVLTGGKELPFADLQGKKVLLVNRITGTVRAAAGRLNDHRLSGQ